MVSKRDLGIGYLLGTGLGLIASLAGYSALVGQPLIDTAVGTATAVGLSGTLLYTGYWLKGSYLDDVVWTVAQWSSLGLAVPAASRVERLIGAT